MVTNYVYVTYGRHAVHKQTLKNHADLRLAFIAGSETRGIVYVDRRAPRNRYNVLPSTRRRCVCAQCFYRAAQHLSRTVAEISRTFSQTTDAAVE